MDKKEKAKYRIKMMRDLLGRFEVALEADDTAEMQQCAAVLCGDGRRLAEDFAPMAVPPDMVQMFKGCASKPGGLCRRPLESAIVKGTHPRDEPFWLGGLIAIIVFSIGGIALLLLSMIGVGS